MNLSKWLCFVAVCAALAAAPPHTAQTQEKTPPGSAAKSDGGMPPAPNPVAGPDRALISITGTVRSTTAETFVLDHGRGTVTVEMDDWAHFDKGHEIVAGHKVTVYGRIDHDLFMKRRIEASMVFDYDRKRYFYANAADEEIAYGPFPFGALSLDAPSAGIAGTVRSIDGRIFVLDVGSGTVRVDTGDMAYDPMRGPDALDAGDRVVVYGTVDDADFFDRREIQAMAILTIGGDGAKPADKAPVGEE